MNRLKSLKYNNNLTQFYSFEYLFNAFFHDDKVALGWHYAHAEYANLFKMKYFAATDL